jgi:two-component system, cell cycle response regulator DivK
MAARILVVEDNPASLELARYLLVAAGHTVLLAIDGAQGLAVARVERPDIIVSDLQMPGMDGFAMIAQLRADAACCDIPVVALTAFSMPGDETRVMQAGFDAYLSKPIEPERFVAQIESALANGRRGSDGNPGARP